MTRVPEIHVLVRIPIPGTKGIPIFWYGVMLLTGFVGATWLARRLARREGVPPATIYDLALWAIISGLAGARLWYVVEFANRFYHRPQSLGDLLRQIGGMLNVSDGGLVFYGGIAAPIVVLALWFRRRRLPALKMFDILAPAAMLGLTFGRIGCFFNGCCFGRVCPADFPLAVQRPRGGPPPVADDSLSTHDYGPTWRFQFNRRDKDPYKGLTATSEWSLPVHPAQLYASAGALGVCVLLLLAYRRKKREGDILAQLLLLYPVLRFLLERVREHEPSETFGALSIAQWISVLAFLTGLGLLIGRQHRPLAVPYVPPEPPPEEGPKPKPPAPPRRRRPMTTPRRSRAPRRRH